MTWPPTEDQQATPEALTVPLFPLPRTVLFPAVKLPFYVFEPRYRTMLSDVLDGSGYIGIPQVLPGFESAMAQTPPITRVFGVGHVADYVTHEDGTSHIEVAGVFRAQLLEELAPGEYRTARVAILQDDDTDEDEVSTLSERLAASVRALMEVSVPHDSRDPIEQLLTSTTTTFTPLVNTLCTVLIADARTRQALLELSGTDSRARRLIAEVEDMRRALIAKTSGDTAEDERESP